MPKKWIDVSVPVRTGMVHWPDNPGVRVERFFEIGKDGKPCNLSVVSMTVHTGTHMDSPLHFIKNGKTMDALPFDATVGPCRVIEVKDTESIKVEHLKGQRLKAGERILFKTRNSKRSWKTDKFDENFIYISKEAAAFLAKAKIRTVGVDYLSVGGYFKDGIETHLEILGAGIWIIEGLNLEKIKPGRYELMCLPVKMEGCDGAPARALLR